MLQTFRVLDQPVFPTVFRKRAAGERRIRIKMSVVRLNSLRHFDRLPDIFLGLGWHTDQKRGARHNIGVI